MKRLLVFFVSFVILFTSSTAFARDDVSMYAVDLIISLIEKDLQQTEMFVDVCYKEENDAILITLKQTTITKKDYDEMVAFNSDLPKQMADICSNYLYGTYQKWVETAHQEIDIVFREISSDNHFLFSVINGDYSEIDILKTEKTKRTQLEIQTINIYLQMMENAFDGMDQLLFQCKYDEEKDEMLFVYTILGFGKKDMEMYNGKKTVKEIKQTVISDVYQPLKEMVDQSGMDGISIVVKFMTSDGVLITGVENGKIIE